MRRSKLWTLENAWRRFPMEPSMLPTGSCHVRSMLDGHDLQPSNDRSEQSNMHAVSGNRACIHALGIVFGLLRAEPTQAVD